MRERLGQSRRVFLGTVGGLAAGAVAGCDIAAPRSAVPAAPGSARPSASPVAQTGDADWPLRSTGPQDAIEGYASRSSIRPGEPITLQVSTTARGFRVSAY